MLTGPRISNRRYWNLRFRLQELTLRSWGEESFADVIRLPVLSLSTVVCPVPSVRRLSAPVCPGTKVPSNLKQARQMTRRPRAPGLSFRLCRPCSPPVISIKMCLSRRPLFSTLVPSPGPVSQTCQPQALESDTGRVKIRQAVKPFSNASVCVTEESLYVQRRIRSLIRRCFDLDYTC